MPAPLTKPRVRFLLQFLIVFLVLAACGRQRQSKRGPRDETRTRHLNSKNPRDVRTFQKILNKADLNYAKEILKLFEGVVDLGGRNNPEKVEERRIELETIERGQWKENVGWAWSGHLVPAPKSTSEHFARRTGIIRNGVWNPSLQGWEYQGEFFGVWE